MAPLSGTSIFLAINSRRSGCNGFKPEVTVRQVLVPTLGLLVRPPAQQGGGHLHIAFPSQGIGQPLEASLVNKSGQQNNLRGVRLAVGGESR
jgi:hypothetical protein